MGQRGSVVSCLGGIVLAAAAALADDRSRPNILVTDCVHDTEAGVIVVHGRGFGGRTPLVRLGGIELELRQSSPREIRAALPAGLGRGTYPLEVTRDGGHAHADARCHLSIVPDAVVRELRLAPSPSVPVSAMLLSDREVAVRFEVGRPLTPSPVVQVAVAGEATEQQTPVYEPSTRSYTATLHLPPGTAAWVTLVDGGDQRPLAAGQLRTTPMGGTEIIDVWSPEADVQVAIAPGALPEGAVVLVGPSSVPPPREGASRVAAGPYVLAASNGAERLEAPASVVFQQPAGAGTGRVWRWDAEEKRWSPLTSITHRHDGFELVVASTDRLGVYALTVAEEAR